MMTKTQKEAIKKARAKRESNFFIFGKYNGDGGQETKEVEFKPKHPQAWEWLEENYGIKKPKKEIKRNDDSFGIGVGYKMKF